MKSLSPTHVLLVVVLSVGVAALTSTLLHEPPAPTAPAKQWRDSVALGQNQKLQEQIQELADRIQNLEMRPVRGERLPAETAYDGAFEQEVRNWMAEMETRNAPLTANLRSKVEQALATIRREEERAKEQVKLQRREDAIDRAVDKLALQLNLGAAQKADLRTAWAAKAEADADLTRRWEEGADKSTLGDTKRLNEQNHHETLRRIFSPDQYESYAAIFGRSKSSSSDEK